MSVEREPNTNPVIQEEETNNNSLEEINAWDNLDISSELLRGIYAMGFEKPSPIQRKAIKPLIDGKDIIAQAQSGTGKTATFTIGALSHVKVDDNTTQILILSPTRELSIQTASVARLLGSVINGLRVQTLVGGSSIDEDARILKNSPPHVITGCPGRVFDMMRRNHINSKNIRLVVLDEADEMLSIGFKEQIYNILQNLRNDIQVALFSATLPDYIDSITSKFMRNPVKIHVKAEQLTLEGISQYYVAVEDDLQKYDTLKDLYSIISVSQCIIYCNSVKRVADLYDAMTEDGFPVCRIHSNMEKSERDQAFNDFKVGRFRVLISSNVTSRGIDIQQVSVVINFDVPKCVHNYLHRIGRSGRWVRKGVGINLVTRRDMPKLREIEQYYSTQINEMPAALETLIK